ncbi:hypothetical protein AVEN_264612-1 [Araneus ventricosus]|uniref:Uncharacterized protein n=1 Tax=Araneus ventricosus TaxID=182803 RepID=A0A4Y2FQC7_ARAVE|nr:hypothetical protein AVEN_264612-1 [Araneus ventricosus]
MISRLTQEVEKCPPESFIPSKRLEIIGVKSRIDDILNCLQDVFSLPSFIIVISNLLTGFSITSLYLDLWISKYPELGIRLLSFNFINSFACLVFILWIAGRIPLEESRFKEAFHTKVKQRMIVVKTPEKLTFEKWLLSKPDFVFSGWDIFSYRRNSIFVLVGTLITYSALIADK